MSEVDSDEGLLVVVIDSGSSVCKCGFAGDGTPRVVFPSIVGRTRVCGGGIVGLEMKTHYVGDEALVKRGILLIRHPIEFGIITNWDDMEKIWHHSFYNELRISPEEHPVILTEIPMNPKANREKTTQIMFETFDIPALYVSNAAALALHAHGKTSGVVLDSGNSATYVVAVHERCIIPHTIQKLEIGGRDLDRHFIKLLNQEGHSFTQSSMELIRDIREKLCYVAVDYDGELEAANSESPDHAKQPSMLEPQAKGSFNLVLKALSGAIVWEGEADLGEDVSSLLQRALGRSEMQSGSIYHSLIINGVNIDTHQLFASCVGAGCESVDAILVACKKVTRSYKLPDDQCITVCSARFHCPEILFKPGHIGCEADGIHRMVFTSVMLCDQALQFRLFSSVVLAGGSTMYAGLGQRLTSELAKLTDSEVSVLESPERRYIAWIGASALASQSLAEDAWISRDEYDEHGPPVVHEKCQ